MAVKNKHKIKSVTEMGEKKYKKVKYFQVTLLECEMKLNNNMEWIFELHINS